MVADSQAPQVVTFQMDASAVGKVQSSVNLFRGDVNFSQSLFKMPGRPSDPALGVDVSLFYQSNVTRAATTWNRDSPAGVAGLGWMLPRTCIELDDGGSPTPGIWSYSYSSDGIATPLICEPQTPLLFQMPASWVTQLQTGAAVPAAIVAAFAARGIGLGAGASVHQAATETGPWTITDTDNQRLFCLNADANALVASDGGQSFQLRNYAFWKILYYDVFERWIIIKDSGHVFSFGGVAAPSAGNMCSIGNSIEWAVRWTAPAGAALWVGPSSQTTGQKQYARCWNLANVTNIWGDSYHHGYNEWPRDTQTGLIPDVEQSVGAGGLPYTKACYLTSISDVFGRKAVFAYDDKQWAISPTDAPREYADPHKAQPDNTANAYQDRYETKYLSGITVQALDGSELYCIQLSYSIDNVNPNAATLQGDTFKRFLTGITMSNASGSSLPGLTFQYHLGPVMAGESPGALAAIGYPEGATVHYTYTPQSLPICDRTQCVQQPAGFTASATPGVWFGGDYVVTTWLGANGGPLSLVVYTWLGRWVSWQISPSSAILPNVAAVEADTLNVIAQENYFALTFQMNSETAVAYVFRRSVGRPGQWLAAQIEGQPLAGSPTLNYPAPNGGAFFTGGTDFLIGGVMDQTMNSFKYDRLTWRWTTATWTRESFSPADYLIIKATNEYCVALDVASGTLSLSWLDPTLTWQAAASSSLPDYSPPPVNNLAITTAPAMAVVSLVENPHATLVTYTLFVIQWDQTYLMQPPQAFTYTDMFASSWTGSIVGPGMVACAGRLLRFNGTEWLPNNALYDAHPIQDDKQRFAYGPDYAIRIVSRGATQPTAAVLAFDPNADCGGWTRSAIVPVQSLPADAPLAAGANWPSSGQSDYMAIGQYLYFRDSSIDWSEPLSAPPLDLQAMVDQVLTPEYFLNTQSLINQAPDFLTGYVYPSADEPPQTAVFLLKNGQLIGAEGQLPGLPTLFADQLIWIPTDGQTPPGAYPSGLGTFATYPSSASSFQQASSFFLHRYAGDAIDGPLIHYAVTGIAVDDGFGNVCPIAYAPDPAQAACDPTGLVIKYYQNTSYPGTSDLTKPPFGCAVSTYINGLLITDDLNYYDMLDGLPDSVEIQDVSGTTISRTAHQWQVSIQRAADPRNADLPPLNLYGGFVSRTALTRVLDGVASTRTTSYTPPGLAAPFSGLPVSTVSMTMGGSGEAEEFTTNTLYGYDVDYMFVPLNLLSPKVQTTTQWQRGSAAAVTVKATASTFVPWPHALAGPATVPGAEADFSWAGEGVAAFPFATYQGGQTPAGWQCTHRTVARSAMGLITEILDGCGTAHSTLYAGEEFPIAEFVNASLSTGACAYAGFEPYEDQNGFVRTGGAIQTGDAHAGDCSLILLPGATLAAQIAPSNTTQTYLLGYWLRAPQDFQPMADCGWSISLSIDRGAPDIRSVPFPSTGGNWTYITIPIPLTAGKQSIAMTVTAVNSSTAMVLLDDVFVAPLVGGTVMRAFSPKHGLLTGVTNASGRTTRRFYDRFQRMAAAVGPDEQTKELVQDFLSRAGNTNGAFDSTNPNGAVTLHASAGGSLESFLTGDDWMRRWQASNAATHWTVSEGALRHTAGAVDTLSWTGAPDPLPAAAALLFEVVPDTTPTGPISVSFGSGYRISYLPGTGYAFTAPGGGMVQAPLVAPPALAGQWLVVLGCGIVLFFGDGQLIFSVAVSYGGIGTVSISAGPNALAFRNLAVVAEPRLAVTYSDAVGRQVQVQQLMADAASAGSDYLVLQHIYDPLNRRVATTRAAPGSFGSGASLAVMAYRPGFANVAAFLAAMNDTWQLTGDVADYYRGQTDGPVPRSDDQGYPYHGTRYAAASLHRPIEQGVPGLEFSIHDLATTSPAQRNTVQLSHGANSGNILNLPSGAYFQRTVTGKAKTQSIILQDSARRPVAAQLLDAAAVIQGQSASEIAFGPSGGTATMRLPNAFAAGPPDGQAGFVTTTLQDSFDRVSSRTDPDSGNTFCLYDGLGRLRVMQPELDPGEVGFLYYRYDPIGRIVEEGIIPQPWDPASLALATADPTWPDAGVARTITRTHSYDGDGNDPASIGKQVQLVTNNPSPGQAPGTCVVTESFNYDPSGRVTSTTLGLVGTQNVTATISYSYNNLDEVVMLTYPQGSPLAQIVYSRDDQGRTIGIGTSTDSLTGIAAYTYTPDGDIETEVRNGGKLMTTYQYNSPGWLVQQTVTAQGRTVPAFSIGVQYNPDGTPQQRDLSWAFAASAQTVSTTYAYDGQRQLTSATVSGDTAGNETIANYDANGNILGASLDGAAWSFICASGSDRLQTGLPSGGTATNFSYSADGWLKTNRNLAISRDRGLGLATSIAVSGAAASQLSFAYSGSGARVVKQVTGGAAAYTRVYFCGTGHEPIASLQGGAWTVVIPGPLGVAAIMADQVYFPIEDRQRTRWALLDTTNTLIARYGYAPFGTPLVQSASTAQLLAHQFMGKALDLETGLYDFGARLYDPTLRRFCSPDMARQYPSPYVFAGNDPLVFLDPTGNLSIWGIVGIAVGMAAITLAGVALTVATGGISDELAVSADATLAGALAADAAGEASADAVAEGTVEGAEVASVQAARAYAQQMALSKAVDLAGNTIGNSVISGGQAGMNYDLQNGRNFTAKGFFEAVATGAVAGGATGFMSNGIAMAMPSLSAAFGRAAGYGTNLALQTAAGGAGAVSGQLFHNALAHAPLGQGLQTAAVGGALRMFAANLVPLSVVPRKQIGIRGDIKLLSGGIKIGATQAETSYHNALQTAIRDARAEAVRAAHLVASPFLLMKGFRTEPLGK